MSKEGVNTDGSVRKREDQLARRVFAVEEVKLWPTPTASEDAAGTPNGKMQSMLGNHPDIRGTTQEEWDGGQLNPTWVEWLMGWPIGWTDLNALATDKCPSVQP